MTHAELMARMSAIELDEWRILQSIDPLPDPWWIAAKICATVINVNRASGAKPIRPEDVLPFLKGPSAPQSEEAKAQAIREWLGGADR